MATDYRGLRSASGSLVGGDLAKEANDQFAPWYDAFNLPRYQFERWTGVLVDRATAVGLPKASNRLLDVGCGTGLSLLPMLERGWEVTACDISPAMVEQAQRRANGRATVVVADARMLPHFADFDLVWAVNDAMNYLLSPQELVASLRGMRRNLAKGGLLLFDLNTLDSYRTFFAEETVVENNGKRYVFRGCSTPAEAHPGMTAEARFEAVGFPESIHFHRQRHFPEAEVLTSIEEAGLLSVDVTGEFEGDLSAPLDEDVHSKAVYICKAVD